MVVGTEESADSVLIVQGVLRSCFSPPAASPTKRIASSLHLAEATVKRHLANVYIKDGRPLQGPGFKRGAP